MDEKLIADLRAKARQISEKAWAPSLLAEKAEHAAAEPYYDAAADKQMQTEFYRGFEPDDDPRKAYDALHALVHPHYGIAYATAKKELYRWIDLHPDRKLRSIYSGDPVDPAKVMEADEEIDAVLLAASKMHRVPLDVLERAVTYNCEHVVPQGWFAEDEPMRGDLHHLFTCDIPCNQYRDNNAYFDFDQGPSKPKCGHCVDPENKFEPVTGKGAVSRATLYFVVCYQGVVRQAAHYNVQRLETVKRWAREGPVSDHEKHRNWTIHTAQKNRNPFVDHPEWIDRIDFSMGLG